MARRAHAAAATRRLVAGLSTAATLGIVAAFGISSSGTDAATTVSTPVAPTTPPTIVQTVYRYVEVPAGGATPSSGRSNAPGSTSAAPAAPAPTPQPAPQPVTRTKGS